MKVYKCLVVDDEKLARQLIESYINRLDFLELVTSCKSAMEASVVMTSQKIDLLFLDIEMPLMLGTDFYKNLTIKPKVVFTTAYRDYAVEGFELDALDYLLKPIDFDRFFKSVQRFLSVVETGKAKEESPDHKPYIYVTEDRKQVKIITNEILYVESVKNYIKICTDKKKHLVKYGLSSFEELLSQKFLRVHRSFIVNIDKITAYTKHDIEIGEFEIPIGESYRERVIDKL